MIDRENNGRNEVASEFIAKVKASSVSRDVLIREHAIQNIVTTINTTQSTNIVQQSISLN